MLAVRVPPIVPVARGEDRVPSCPSRNHLRGTERIQPCVTSHNGDSTSPPMSPAQSSAQRIPASLVLEFPPAATHLPATSTEPHGTNPTTARKMGFPGLTPAWAPRAGLPPLLGRSPLSSLWD